MAKELIQPLRLWAKEKGPGILNIFFSSSSSLAFGSTSKL